MYIYIPTAPETYPEMVLDEAHRRVARLERERARRAERRARRRRRLKSLRSWRRADYAPPQEDR